MTIINKTFSFTNGIFKGLRNARVHPALKSTIQWAIIHISFPYLTSKNNSFVNNSKGF